MLTISKIETPLRSLGGSRADGDRNGLLAKAALASSATTPGFSRSEFLSDMDPYAREQWSRRLAANRQWLLRVLNRELGPSSAELTKTVKAVFAVLSEFGAGAIDLRHLPTQINGVHLGLVLRSTADELENTEAWQRALVLAEEVLIQDGVDPQDALLGMIPRK